ncbi:MAG: hypothetical protein WCB32_20800, partial [Pseudolabrys sp.]
MRAKHCLERLDLMAKSRRRNIELLGRAREMQLFRDGHEIPKMTQFHRLKCHLLERCWWRSSASLTGFWFEVLLSVRQKAEPTFQTSRFGIFRVPLSRGTKAINRKLNHPLQKRLKPLRHALLEGFL